MIMSWLIVLLYSFSIVLGTFFGTIGEVSSAMLEGAENAVTLCLSLAGPICLWSALQNVMEVSGISEKIASACAPFLRLVFPESARDRQAAAAISQNLSANLLGLGNAATPAGIRAVERMRTLSGSDQATHEMCRLIVMNTASVQLLPATVAAARAALGSAAPYAILPAVWLSSLCSVSVGLLSARGMEALCHG